MKSRFAVSVLFILIAATFTSDAIGAFEKLRSWTGMLCDRYSMPACNRVSLPMSAPMSALNARDKRSAHSMRLDGGRQPLGQGCATGNQAWGAGAISPGSRDQSPGSCKGIRKAARQIREVLDLMRTK
jgi:hypothetical protein